MVIACGTNLVNMRRNRRWHVRRANLPSCNQERF